MEDTQETIGLTELLDEVSRDIDELRKKHPSDYGIKNLTMWWELERERLVARHGLGALVKKLRKVHSMRKMLGLFTVGWLTMLCIQMAIRLLFP